MPDKSSIMLTTVAERTLRLALPPAGLHGFHYLVSARSLLLSPQREKQGRLWSILHGTRCSVSVVTLEPGLYPGSASVLWTHWESPNTHAIAVPVSAQSCRCEKVVPVDSRCVRGMDVLLSFFFSITLHTSFTGPGVIGKVDLTGNTTAGRGK